MVLPPGLLTDRPCEEVFREALVGYDGFERFDASLVTALSDQFVELRPDCLAQGWAPEFPEKPQVCEESEDLPGAITYRFNERNPTRLVAPTQWVVSERQEEGVGFIERIDINVHLNRMPRVSDIPASMNPTGGDLIGGCWTYTGEHFENGQSRGRWSKSYFKYVLNPAGIAARNRVFPSGGRSEVVGVTSPTSHPECDARLQDLLSVELDAGAAVDSAAVAALVARVRAEEKEACAPLGPDLTLWQPLPLDGPSSACPVGASPGLQPDGSYVLNWGEGHYDLYRHSDCWLRSPEGEWGAYLVSEDGPARPEAPVVEA